MRSAALYRQTGSVASPFLSVFSALTVLTLIQVVPSHIRTAGFSLSYSLATAVFRGFTLAFGGVCCLVATVLLYTPGAWAARLDEASADGAQTWRFPVRGEGALTGLRSPPNERDDRQCCQRSDNEQSGYRGDGGI